MSKKRVLIKISGELFKSDQAALDLAKANEIAVQIKKIYNDYNLGIVFGGGNIFRGRNVENIKVNMATAHMIGTVSSLPNGIALKSILDAIEIPSRIISAFSAPDVVGVPNKFDVDKYFNLNEVLIFVGGTGLPFFTHDTAAVVRALEIRAEFLLKATNVKGIYDSDPKINPGANKFDQISYNDFLSLKGASILDRSAVVLAEENKLPIYVFKWQTGCLRKAVKLKAGGTLIQ